MFGLGEDGKDTITSTKRAEAGAQRVLIVTDDKCNELECFVPYYRFCEAGLRVDIATPKGGSFKGAHGTEFRDAQKVSAVRAQDYALLYLPGGKAPASLRKDEEVLALVRQFAQDATPIAAICHAAQILVSAGLARGKRLAAYPEVKDEIEEAGGTFVNAPLSEDGIFITARWPGDLPGHLEAAMRCLGVTCSVSGRKHAA